MLEVIFSTGQSERLLPNREVLIQKHRAVVNIYLPSFCKQSKILINEMLLYMEGGGGYGIKLHFQQCFTYIVAVNFIGGENH